MANLPSKESHQFSNVHFLCCSNKVSALDMTEALVDQLLQLEGGVILYDSFLKGNVFVRASVICILADNARASEIANHLGATAKKFCRKCMVRLIHVYFKFIIVHNN